MTLKEIAKEVGVSISTVSRVINRKGTNAASKEVQDRIWEVVRETGYVPNAAAQSLKRSDQPMSLDTAPHVIACLFARSPAAINDPFFTRLARSVEECAYQKNYVVKFLFTALDLDHPGTMQIIMDNHVEGIVVLGRCEKKLLATIKRELKNVVCVSLNATEDRVDQIICDGLDIGRAVVDYLIDLGHQNIGYIGEIHNEIRYNGYRSALTARNLPIQANAVVDVILSSDGGYRGAKQLFRQAPEVTAIFCANDATAVGAIHALQEEGVKIPGDISVISVDNIEMAQYVSPPLTTVQIPLEEMGHMAFSNLADRITGGHRIPIRVSVPFSLVERESCAKPNRRKK